VVVKPTAFFVNTTTPRRACREVADLTVGSRCRSRYFLQTSSFQWFRLPGAVVMCLSKTATWPVSAGDDVLPSPASQTGEALGREN
jgi:hypothetical protein